MRRHSKIADLGELNHLVSDPQISSTNAASLPGVPCGPGSSNIIFVLYLRYAFYCRMISKCIKQYKFNYPCLSIQFYNESIIIIDITIKSFLC